MKEETSSIGQAFRYRYHVNLDKSEVFFEYENKDEGGTFKLDRLSWLSATNSPHTTARSGAADTISFSGFGTWTTDGKEGKIAKGTPHQLAVHISTSKDDPYVGIMVDAGRTSNVNTKPVDIADSIPAIAPESSPA